MVYDKAFLSPDPGYGQGVGLNHIRRDHVHPKAGIEVHTLFHLPPSSTRTESRTTSIPIHVLERRV